MKHAVFCLFASALTLCAAAAESLYIGDYAPPPPGPLIVRARRTNDWAIVASWTIATSGDKTRYHMVDTASTNVTLYANAAGVEPGTLKLRVEQASDARVLLGKDDGAGRLVVSPSTVIGGVDYSLGTVALDVARTRRVLGAVYPAAFGAFTNAFAGLSANLSTESSANQSRATRQTRFALGAPDAGALTDQPTIFEAFLDADANGVYTTGEYYGSSGVVLGSATNGADLDFEVSNVMLTVPRMTVRDLIAMSAITNDVGDRVRMGIVLDKINGRKNVGTYIYSTVILDAVIGTEDESSDAFAFARTGHMDIGWGIATNIHVNVGIPWADITNVEYYVALDKDPERAITTNSLEVYRFNIRHELERSVASPVYPSGTTSGNLVFTWSLAARKTYPAFQLVVKSGDVVVYDSGARRMPAKDADGIYSFRPSVELQPGNYTWQIAPIDSKFTSLFGRYFHGVTTSFTIQ